METFLEALSIVLVLGALLAFFWLLNLLLSFVFRRKYDDRKKYLENQIKEAPFVYDFFANEIVCEYILLCLKMGYKDREIFDMLFKLRKRKTRGDI